MKKMEGVSKMAVTTKTLGKGGSSNCDQKKSDKKNMSKHSAPIKDVTKAKKG